MLSSYLCIIFENCHFHECSQFYQRFPVLWSKSKTEIKTYMINAHGIQTIHLGSKIAVKSVTGCVKDKNLYKKVFIGDYSTAEPDSL